jgi:hypothetical protein
MNDETNDEMNDEPRPASGHGARWKAIATIALLVLASGTLGALVDRVWLRTPAAGAMMPLTAEALAEQLELDPSEAARVRALLDSMHAEVVTAIGQGPDALAAAADHARVRLEGALPPDARPAFRRWMEDHHRQMMERMGGGPMHGPGLMRGMPPEAEPPGR